MPRRRTPTSQNPFRRTELNMYGAVDSYLDEGSSGKGKMRDHP